MCDQMNKLSECRLALVDVEAVVVDVFVVVLVGKGTDKQVDDNGSTVSLAINSCCSNGFSTTLALVVVVSSFSNMTVSLLLSLLLNNFSGRFIFCLFLLLL